MRSEGKSNVLAAGGEAKTSYWIAAGLIVLLGGLVRFYRAGEQIILDDEWHALNVVQDTDYGFIFSHLSLADHSIPLALLFEWFSHTIGLSEFTMRLPSLLAGVVIIAAFPLLMRPWLSRDERVVTAALLALSPFLINFSRVARPYSLLALLTGCSLPLAWRWWQSERRGFGPAWYLCTVLAAWLNPVSLVITTAPFLWFGMEALVAGVSGRGWRPLRRLATIGMAMLATLGALFYLPIESDFVSLTLKSGMDEANFGTWSVLLGLYSGSGYDAIVAALVLASWLGLLILRQRDSSFSVYLAGIAVLSGFAVSIIGAQWLQYGLVPARYLIGLLPAYLALIAIALAVTAGWLQRKLNWPLAARHGFTLVLLLLLILAGPLRSWDLAHSQFVHHLARQFDYKPSRNAILLAHEPLQVEPFYAEIAQLHPNRDAVIIEAPWYLESHWNPLYLEQRVHGQRVLIGFVGGLCAGPLYGELKLEVAGLEFRNFVYLTDVLAGRVSADYLVLRRAGIDGARTIDMDFDRCEQAVRKGFGAPWRTAENVLVFSLDSGG
jgi:hypothetical protein